MIFILYTLYYQYRRRYTQAHDLKCARMGMLALLCHTMITGASEGLHDAAMLCYAILCYTMLSQVLARDSTTLLCYAMLYYVILCYHRC